MEGVAGTDGVVRGVEYSDADDDVEGVAGNDDARDEEVIERSGVSSKPFRWLSSDLTRNESLP